MCGPPAPSVTTSCGVGAPSTGSGVQLGVDLHRACQSVQRAMCGVPSLSVGHGDAFAATTACRWLDKLSCVWGR
jgi:hypothetical protein